MSWFKPRKIYVHPSVLKEPVTQRILSKLPDVPWEVQDKPGEVARTASDAVGEGKHIWFLTSSPGQLVKECPATPVQLCCRYHVINVITNCPMDCSYCILQGYINNPCITLHVNLDHVKAQINHFLKADPHHIFRFGTGELSDSLALEEYTEFSTNLARFFLNTDNGFFEIKTKSHHVEKLLEVDPKGRIGVSWSVNPEDVIRGEEKGASSLKLRLEAAQACQEKGYLIGFHFDPIILIPEWERKYREVVDAIYARLNPEKIVWISLGGFRYPGFLKPVIQERFPGSTILLGELFPGPDGKYRYLKSLRVAMYRKVAGWIKEYDPEGFIYFCMESPEVWEAVFGFHPANRNELDRLFAQRIRRLWNKE